MLILEYSKDIALSADVVVKNSLLLTSYLAEQYMM